LRERLAGVLDGQYGFIVSGIDGVSLASSGDTTLTQLLWQIVHAYEGSGRTGIPEHALYALWHLDPRAPETFADYIMLRTPCLPDPTDEYQDLSRSRALDVARGQIDSSFLAAVTPLTAPVGIRTSNAHNRFGGSATHPGVERIHEQEGTGQAALEEAVRTYLLRTVSIEYEDSNSDAESNWSPRYDPTDDASGTCSTYLYAPTTVLPDPWDRYYEFVLAKSFRADPSAVEAEIERQIALLLVEPDPYGAGMPVALSSVCEAELRRIALDESLPKLLTRVKLIARRYETN
jgi:hypothetical protein